MNPNFFRKYADIIAENEQEYSFELDEVAPPGREAWVRKNKQRFIDQYGREKGLSVLYATAWRDHNQHKQLMRINEITEAIAPKKLVSCPIKKSGITVTQFRDSYMQHHGVGVRQLIHGDCEEFADEFIATFGGNMYVTPEDERFGNYYHFFMQLGDRFYDGACPEGVTDWRELPSIREYF